MNTIVVDQDKQIKKESLPKFISRQINTSRTEAAVKSVFHGVMTIEGVNEREETRLDLRVVRVGRVMG
jgi:hypothetical protein